MITHWSACVSQNNNLELYGLFNENLFQIIIRLTNFVHVLCEIQYINVTGN